MTTIHIDDNTWKKLNQIRQVGESMNEVVQKLILLSGLTKEDDIIDDRDFNIVLEEFVKLQEGIEDVIEESKTSFGKVLS